MFDTSERFALLFCGGQRSEFGQVYASCHPLKDTSHDEGVILKTKHTSMISTLNRSQFRQVYIVILFSLHSLSNTTREQHMRAPSPIFTVSSLGKSIPHLTLSCSLCMINSPSLYFPNVNASLPSRMEVSSGKSNHHSLSGTLTLEHCTTTITECIVTEQQQSQAGQIYPTYSIQIIHLLPLSQTATHSISCHATPPLPSLPKKADSQ